MYFYDKRRMHNGDGTLRPILVWWCEL